jgi:hypothetical protein
MSIQVSERLRDALERLDEAIDRLDARVSEHLESVRASQAVSAPAMPAPAVPAAVNPMIAERLDRIIRRIELALVE